MALASVATFVVVACEAPTPASTVSAPTILAPTPAPTPRLAVAVAVGSPTPTPELVGDYASLMRPRVQTLRQSFSQLEQQLAIAQKTPMRMAQDDWRTQTQNVLGDMLAASADMRGLATRLATPQDKLNVRVLKLADDSDFVANEFSMAFDYDPDATHFMRAGRAEKMTIDELNSILQDLH